MTNRSAFHLLGIDVGGTFTDVAILNPHTNTSQVLKVSSTPVDPSEGIFQGIQEALTQAGAQPPEIGYLAHGTTVGINALLQHKGANVLLFTTEGFGDLLEIRRQKRPDLYDLFADKPPTLIPRAQRFEVAERIDAAGQVVRALDEEALQQLLDEVEKDAPPQAIAVCLLFSFLNSSHEEEVAAHLRQRFPHAYITISSAVAPEFREFERLGTTVLNGCLGPVMARYLTNFADRVRQADIGVTPYIAQSNGGILSVEQAIRLPVRTIASGPSAGVVGAVQVAQASGHGDLLTFDMGGTSADVCLIKAGQPLVTTNREVAGLPVKSPMIDVHSIGAGGGSIAWVDEAGAFWVGPQSAGSEPGPACYGRGGQFPTVTDANVILGRLNPHALLDGALPIERDRAVMAMQKVAARLACTVEEAAAGVLAVVTAGMTRALRLISVERGEDPADFVLVAYGGAGPLHGALVAEELGCRRVLVPPNPGILCGIGLLLSAPRMDFVRSRRVRISAETTAEIGSYLAEMQQEAQAWFAQEQIPHGEQQLVAHADLRYRRQNFELTIGLPPQAFQRFDGDALGAAFHDEYEKQYGYAMRDQPIELINLRVTAVGQRALPDLAAIGRAAHPAEQSAMRTSTPETSRTVWFADAPQPTPIYRRDALPIGSQLPGPAIAEQYDSTTVVPPKWRATCDQAGNLLLAQQV